MKFTLNLYQLAIIVCLPLVIFFSHDHFSQPSANNENVVVNNKTESLVLGSTSTVISSTPSLATPTQNNKIKPTISQKNTTTSVSDETRRNAEQSLTKALREKEAYNMQYEIYIEACNKYSSYLDDYNRELYKVQVEMGTTPTNNFNPSVAKMSLTNKMMVSTYGQQSDSSYYSAIFNKLLLLEDQQQTVETLKYRCISSDPDKYTY